MPKQHRDGEVTHALFVEPLELADSDVRFTADGYLVAMPRFARSGIQIYAGREVGAGDMETVRVYRSPDEVFHVDSLVSWAHKPITLDHPPVPVTSKNWKELARGQADGQVARDGEFVRIPMMVTDQEAIDAWKRGKKQLSGGYRADLVWGKGKDPQGHEYDAAQRDIRGNHIAMCNVARGGPMLTIGDSFADFTEGNRRDDPPPRQQRRRFMPGNDVVTRVMPVDGIQCEMTDTAASVVQRSLDQRDTAIRAKDAEIAKLTADALAAKTTADAAAKELQKKFDEASGKITVLEKEKKDAELTPEKRDALVRDRMSVVTGAMRLLGDKFNATNKTDVAIMREVCDAQIGAEATKAMNDDAVKGAFLHAVASLSKNGQGGGNGGGFGNTNDTARMFSQPSSIHSSQDAARVASQSWDQSVKRTQDAWMDKPPVQQQQ